MARPGGVPEGGTLLPGFRPLTVFEYRPYTRHHPAHEIRQLAVSFLRLAAKRLSGPSPFPSQHRSQAQPLKQGRGDDPDGPAAKVLALVASPPRLGHLHESGFSELPDGPLAPTLAEAGIPDNGLHVDVDEAVGQCRHAEAQGSQIEVGEQRFNDHEAGLPALASGFAVALGQK